jgi:hypothetical protein
VLTHFPRPVWQMRLNEKGILVLLLPLMGLI